MDLRYRKMLTDLAQKLRSEEINNMKYLCSDKVPKRRQEEIKSGVDLWDALEERDLLSEDNIDFLRFLLESGTNKRIDVLNILAVYENGGGFGFPSTIPRSSKVPPYTDASHDMQQEFEYIAENIGKNWRQLARRLGVTDPQIDNIQECYPRDLREQAYRALQIWVGNNPTKANKDILVQTLRSCKLNYIADEIMMKIIQKK